MPVLCRIAIRNVLRHRRRTLITAGAVTLAVAFMTVAAGFLDFTFWGLRQSTVYGGLGHFQVAPKSLDARARLSSELTDAVVSRLRGDPAIEYVARRLDFQGLVSAGPHTMAFSGVGVEPLEEAKVRAVTLVAAGRWFTGGERVPQVLVGSGLAQRLEVAPRAMLSLITYSDRDRLSASDVQVAGIFESGVLEYDARTLLVPLPVARDLMETDGYGSIVATVRGDDVAAFSDPLARWIAPRDATVKVVRWDELSPVYGSVVRLYRWMLRLFLAIVTVVVVLGIANTMSMAVLERVAEVGVLRALGFASSRVVGMFLCEAATIGGFGALGGIVLGAAACVGLTWLGIEMPPPPGRSQGYVVAIHLVPAAFANAAGIAIAAALVAGVGPSLRAIRKEVADVLRAV